MSDPHADGGPVRDALNLLAGLPGIVGVQRVGSKTIEQVVELESRYERGVVVPLKNLGVHVVLKRKVAAAVLKDRHFRGPPAPTVYLVEEAAQEQCPPGYCIEVEGTRYRVVGEEILPSSEPYREKTVPLGDSFVIFPDRRSSHKTPSYFLVPPLGFPELEAVEERLGIRGVVSISPSTQADSRLREVCGFPEDPSLATLLVAFDLVEGSA
jgi:hypothetical protein